MTIQWSQVVAGMSEDLRTPKFPRAVLGVELNFGDTPAAVIDVETRKHWNANTIFSIGSISKAFIAVAILKLIEQNPGNYFGTNVASVALDKYVYQLGGMQPLGTANAETNPDYELKRQIKLKHLVTHTSAMKWFERFAPRLVIPRPAVLPCIGSSGYIGSPGLTNECIYDYDDRRWKPARTVTLSKVARHVMHQPLLPRTTPGTKVVYSNFDYILLGRIIEAATGSSFNRYLRTNVFDYLGMTDSFFVAQPPDARDTPKIGEGVNANKLPRIADITMITPGQVKPPEIARPLVADDRGRNAIWDERRRGWSLAWPEGGMYSTLRDLLTFLRMLRRNGQTDTAGQEPFLTQASIDLLMQRQVTDAEMGCAPDCSNVLTMGLGLITGSAPTIGTGLSVVSVWSEGRFMTFMWLDPVKQISGVFLSQRIPNLSVIVPGDNSRAEGEAAINKFTRLASDLR